VAKEEDDWRGKRFVAPGSSEPCVAMRVFSDRLGPVHMRADCLSTRKAHKHRLLWIGLGIVKFKMTSLKIAPGDDLMIRRSANLSS